MDKMTSRFFRELEETIQNFDVSEISEIRKEILQPLIRYIRDKLEAQEEIRLNFICTHNSRRSHLSQVWAQTMAACLGVLRVSCYSGGTEATALSPMVIETLRTSGFQVGVLSASQNPIYSIKSGPGEVPIVGFSKTFDHPYNPKSGFAAIMTCSQADEGCPFIAGAEKRIPLTYDDPKIFDGTPRQAQMYMERSRQIATEMFYAFSSIDKI